jgi:hypothetical protein
MGQVRWYTDAAHSTPADAITAPASGNQRGYIHQPEQLFVMGMVLAQKWRLEVHARTSLWGL